MPACRCASRLNAACPQLPAQIACRVAPAVCPAARLRHNALTVAAYARLPAFTLPRHLLPDGLSKLFLLCSVKDFTGVSRPAPGRGQKLPPGQQKALARPLAPGTRTQCMKALAIVRFIYIFLLSQTVILTVRRFARILQKFLCPPDFRHLLPLLHHPAAGRPH